MKIETIDMVSAEPEPEAPRRTDKGLIARAAIVTVLALFLIIALQWAVGVTNANARQLSTNLTSLQDQIDRPDRPSSGASVSRGGPTRGEGSSAGPVLEPADSR